MSAFEWQCFILYRQQNSKKCGPLCSKSLLRDISKAHADDNDCLSQKNSLLESQAMCMLFLHCSGFFD